MKIWVAWTQHYDIANIVAAFFSKEAAMEYVSGSDYCMTEDEINYYDSDYILTCVEVVDGLSP